MCCLVLCEAFIVGLRDIFVDGEFSTLLLTPNLSLSEVVSKIMILL